MTAGADIVTACAKSAAGKVRILGCDVDRLDMAETLERCERLIDSRAGAQHVVVNAAKLVAMQDDERLRSIVQRCELVNADGQSVVWAARLLGHPLPERVAGIDLMERLLERAEEREYRVFFLGARADVLDEAMRRLRARHPRLRIAGYRDGYFRDGDSAAVCSQIRGADPDILFVAMTSPRKEQWLADHLAETRVPLGMGVGGALDVVAGATRRAPRWMQRAGLEWLFRLLQEPRRLWRRYLVTNSQFALLVVREFRRCRKRRQASR
jgi:N-acetylglucosaminyldiphosphoundecaprenol N-acetyl-beta-D-mannosaminyltransferase